MFFLAQCAEKYQRDPSKLSEVTSVKTKATTFTGKIYLAGNVPFSFVALQIDSETAIVLFGVDSLRNYQNYRATVTGEWLGTTGDSLRVTKVNILPDHNP